MIPHELEVPSLSKHRIELEAQRLLFGYGRAYGPIAEPPVPIEEILERHLGLNLAFCQLRDLTGRDDALGALCVERREVMIDESLDPEEFPELEGRFRFTLAHEIGHWLLHRGLYDRLCRTHAHPSASHTSPPNRRLERQADFFAACALMPRPLVYQVWRHVCGGRVISLTQLRAIRPAISVGQNSDCEVAAVNPDDASVLLEYAAAPLAVEFCVSPVAMRIRLEELGLIHR